MSNRLTVNPRISPQGLIVNFEILHGGLIEGGLFEGGGLLKIVSFYMGAKSKWQVDLQDTIDAQAFNAEKWDISCFGGRCNPRCRSEKTVNYFPFFVNFFDIENIWISIVLHNKLLFSFTPRGLIQHRFIFNLFFDFYISPLGAYSREGAYCKKWGLPWGLIWGEGLIEHGG